MDLNARVVKISVHLCIWILLLISTINYSMAEDTFANAVLYSFVWVLINAAYFYLNYFFFADLLILKKKIFLYAAAVAATFGIVFLVSKFENFTWWILNYWTYNSDLELIINIVIIFGLSNIVRGLEYWVEIREKHAQLEKENIAKELNFLKSQINPHFLFNTLNNIYSLAYHKDDNAAEMIAKLSKLLRYMLYECRNNRVHLRKEMEMIKNYIDLEILRLGENRNIDFYQEGIRAEHKIAPLILINSIENAFKHSDISTNKAGWIKIESTVEDNKLKLCVENSKQLVENTEVHSGIGLTNLKKQLELNYKNKSSVDIKNETDKFRIIIEVELNG